MKNINQWIFCLGVWVVAIGGIVLCFGVYNNGMERHESWSRGYTDCMNHVVEALVKHDEVRIGNLVVNEPNTYVSDITFFVVDPNVYGVVVEANDVTITDGSYSSLCTEHKRPDSSEPTPNQFSQDCPCGAHLSGPYEGDGFKFVCARCGREYSYRWQEVKE